MTSLRQQVFNIYDVNINTDGIHDTSYNELCRLFPNANKDVLKVYLSEARSPNRKIKDQPIKKINLDQIESRILAIVNKAPNAQNMKLALDFIRLKQSSEGLQDEIDIEKYLKKVESITNGGTSVCETSGTHRSNKESSVADSTPYDKVRDADITKSPYNKLIYDTMTHQDSVKETKDNGEL